MDTALTYQAYYTKSNPILNYMTGMLHFKPHDHILEPCGGDGVFIDKILESIQNVQINVFELNPSAVTALKASIVWNLVSQSRKRTLCLTKRFWNARKNMTR